MVHYTIEDITPGKAQEYLNTSLGNRNFSDVFIHSYADTMKRGAWMENGVPIIFDYNGHLLDGHHRLKAVIVANIPVRFNVGRGASPDAFNTYDCGRHRNIGQLLAMQGIKHYNLVGSIVIANDRLIKSGRLYTNNTTNTTRSKNTNAQYYELFARDPEGFQSVASRVVQLESRCRILVGSWAGGLYYYLTHTGGYTEQEVDPFFDSLFSLDTTEGPAELLRKAITKERVEGRTLKAETLWAFIVKAWNGYITGKYPKILRYQNDEKMPSLILR